MPFIKAQPKKAPPIHERRVQDLCKQGAQRRGFVSTVVRECDAGYLDTCRRGIGLVPDAYRIEDHRRTETWFWWKVTAIEVENTSPVTFPKLRLYRRLFWILDEDYIALELEIHHKLGGSTTFSWKDLAGYGELLPRLGSAEL